MIWNAPIWLNRLLVVIVEWLVNFSLLFWIISPFVIIYRVFSLIRNRVRIIDYFKDSGILMTMGSLIVGGLIWALFYLPQPVVPDNYDFDSISIRIEKPSLLSNIIVIKNKEQLKEFRNLFEGYICKRSLDTGSTLIDSDILFIDTHVFVDKKSTPLHFIIEQNCLRRYTAGNTDFVYIIEDKEKMLAEKIFAYVKKYDLEVCY